jgi:two-component system nitrate/nitrite sensor histidine kinase NarX
MDHPTDPWGRSIPRLLWRELSWPLAIAVAALAGLAAVAALSLAGHPPPAALPPVLTLTLAAAFGWLGVRLLRRLLLIARLRDWAEHMRGGNLNAKISLAAAGGELAELIEDINSLGGMLEKLALHMDAQSRAQNVRLARKTQSLDILYEVAASLTRPGNLDRQLGSFLDTFIELVDARAATVHLLTEEGILQLIASRRLERAAAGRPATHCRHCGWIVSGPGVHILDEHLECVRRRRGHPRADEGEVVVVPVQYQGRALGIYTLHLDWPVAFLGEDALELFISVGRHLGLAIEKARLDSDARRLAIMEERQMLANELHDSLAQSLVSMRLQTTILGEQLQRSDLGAAQKELRGLHVAIEEAHASLRELLANFRLRIDERGLIPAVRDMVARFSSDTGIAVFFQNEWREINLSPAQEVQVFHIVQEALANIRKHAHARNARVLLTQQDRNRYTVLIEDDGGGMVAAPDGRPGEHIGLSIMQERARRLPGELTIESEPGEGARIVLSFAATATDIPQAVGG